MNNLLVGIPRLCECFSCFKGTSYPHPVFSNPVIFVLKKENHLSDRPSVRRHLCSQPLIDSLFQTATAKLDFKYHPQSDNSHPCMIVDECGCFTPNYMIVLAFYVHTHTRTHAHQPQICSFRRLRLTYLEPSNASGVSWALQKIGGLSSQNAELNFENGLLVKKN